MSEWPQVIKHHGKCTKEQEFALVLKKLPNLSPGDKPVNK